MGSGWKGDHRNIILLKDPDPPFSASFFLPLASPYPLPQAIEEGLDLQLDQLKEDAHSVGQDVHAMQQLVKETDVRMRQMLNVSGRLEFRGREPLWMEWSHQTPAVLERPRAVSECLRTL